MSCKQFSRVLGISILSLVPFLGGAYYAKNSNSGGDNPGVPGCLGTYGETDLMCISNPVDLQGDECNWRGELVEHFTGAADTYSCNDVHDFRPVNCTTYCDSVNPGSTGTCETALSFCDTDKPSSFCACVSPTPLAHPSAGQ